KEWSTAGITTNKSGNVTVCTSTHMTAFSLLLDPLPGMVTARHHYRILSLISYVGCIMSVVGLFFTILTYALFRCLNKDRSGKILLNLCSAMLLLNVSFLVGSLHERFPKLELCLGTAVATHYFLLACLAWMGVEASNMYQMLVHVFATSETCFMLKRVLVAWGIPAIVVGTCLAIDLEPYRNRDDYCVISSKNQFIYYIAFLGISCLILFVNLLVFIMVTRVLFKPRMAEANSSKSANHNSCSASSPSGSAAANPPITAAQVRGAFTVMTLLGVTWIFGVFAVGEAKTVFQYVFCVCNSMQGFLIFVVRVLQYPEARASWAQLVTTAARTAPALWCSTATSGVRGGNGAAPGARDHPARLPRFSGVGKLLKNSNVQKDDKNSGTLTKKKKPSHKGITDEPDSKENHKEFYSSEPQVASMVPDLYSGQEQQIIKTNTLRVTEPVNQYHDQSRNMPTTIGLAGDQKAHILFAYAGGETTPIRINGIVQSPLDKPKLESFSTFQRPSPVPASTPSVPELPHFWNVPSQVATVVAEPSLPEGSDRDPLRSSVKAATEETSFTIAKGAGVTVAS
ncbi:hypothetical protein MTO96_040187, partial [Rhipicephalus appendiculatus]